MHPRTTPRVPLAFAAVFGAPRTVRAAGSRDIRIDRQDRLLPAGRAPPLPPVDATP